MRQWLLISAVIFNLHLAGTAIAADFGNPVHEPVAPSSWTGFYIGTGIGFRANNVDAMTTSEIFNLGPIDLLSLGCTLGFSCSGQQSLGSTSPRASDYIGYNWQFAPQWLAGIEGDYGFGSKTTTLNGVMYPGGGVLGGPETSFAVKMEDDASLRARLGYLLVPDFLVYVTSGAAWQKLEATSTCNPPTFFSPACSPLTPAVITDSTWKMGFTVGGGIETLISGHLMLRGELRYSNFGTITNTDTRSSLPLTLSTTYTVKPSTESATLGLAYKF